MSGEIFGDILGLLPVEWWFIVAFAVWVTAWALGGDNDKNSDQDSITRLLSGFGSVLYLFVKLAGGLLLFVGKGGLGLVQKADSALRRLGKWAEENVSIDIVLDGNFWRLVTVAFLVGSGYLTYSAFSF
ncbi:hypothetical protein [Halobacterium yunchengense]|uniref:hypothetical protein n=1 Tax=Halobacterium yunchengense TaxID=3108497 RepID=UPI003008E573